MSYASWASAAATRTTAGFFDAMNGVGGWADADLVGFGVRPVLLAPFGREIVDLEQARQPGYATDPGDFATSAARHLTQARCSFAREAAPVSGPPFRGTREAR